MRRAAPALGLGLIVGIVSPRAAMAQAALPEVDFQYHAQPGDTLIGLGRRLLLEPRRWRELQARNHIADPRRIPRGSVVQIPYEWLRTSAESASVANVTGTVQRAGGTVAQGDTLPEGSVIETGSDGSVTIDLADGSVLTLQRSSTLRLDQMTRVAGVPAAHSTRLKLDSGRVETAVQPHRDVGRFEIITPVAVSAVRGTHFRDAFHGDDDQATTETLEGTVSVAGSTAAVPVSAGFGTRVERDQPPLPPVALLPPPDLSGLPSINSSATLRIAWQGVAGAKAYRVQLATDAEFHAVTADTVTSGEMASLTDVPDGNYWLRARSIDGMGLEGEDAVRRITQHLLPDPPRPVAPANAAKITGTQIHLAWTDMGPGLRYALQVARDPAFTAPVLDRSALSANAADIDELPPGQYFWRIASLNAHDEAGPWSDVHSYVQRAATTQPDVPQLTGKHLTISWQAVPGQSYRAQIARDADFKHPVFDRRLDEPRYTLRKLFPGTYYLRVQGIDPDGGAGPFGPSRRFQSPIPLWVKIATPAALALTLLLL